MPQLLANLGKGINKRVKKLFYNPYRVFNIGWTKEKILKHQTNKSLKFHIYKNKYKIGFRDAPVFLISINELFINEFYKFRTNSDRPKIIDCGSYIGTSILYFKDNYPNAIVTGFEPDETNFSIIKSNLDAWNFSDTIVINAAIWINNETISFNSKGSMASRIEAGAIEDDNKKVVKCVRLKDLLIEEIDFLKIDIEGAEHAVLKDCSGNLSKVKNLFVEYHGTYSEMYKLNEILEILVQNKFKYYIKEGSPVYAKPFWDRDKTGDYDIILNIFAFRD
ncbi:MAG TPA: FkbM family methyltransferase [Puia sp.]|jgi:FkbM family methyltransferase|nr:FkbM family methyltransferase [Puia sp.]